MNKYVYAVVGSNGKCVAGGTHVRCRSVARDIKQQATEAPIIQFGEVGPFKIIRYELTNPTIIR